MKKEASVNLKGEDGNTALMAAIKSRPVESDARLKVINLLLDSKADINTQNDDGNFPLLLAIQHGLTDIAQLLVSKKADLNLKNEAGYFPLKSAVQQQCS